MKNKIYTKCCNVCNKQFILKIDKRWTKEEEKWQKEKFREKVNKHEDTLEIEV